jgi:D-alanyl-D-alanine carboxypeptidase
VTGIYLLDPRLQPWARWLISLWPYGQLTSTLRTREEQTALYSAYLAGASRYPAAPPGHSKHELGLAFDYVAPSAVLSELGAVWKSYGGNWGGDGDDPIHFEA